MPASNPQPIAEQAVPEPVEKPKRRRPTAAKSAASKPKATKGKAAKPKAAKPASAAKGRTRKPATKPKTRTSKKATDEPGGGVAEAPTIVRTGSADRHLVDDEPVLPQPARRPRSVRDLDSIPDDFDE